MSKGNVMVPSLLSVLTFVALLHAKALSATLAVIDGDQNAQAVLGKWPSAISRSVIAQMFEWTWDSVAEECTSFLGPAGYGFVQGEHLKPTRAFMHRVLTVSSEPRTGARPGPSVVDRLPARLVQPHIQARYARPVCEYGQHLPRSWR